MSRFQDKVVIVTGAGSGIGAATARRFADEGAHVVLVARTRADLEKVAQDCGANCLVHPADVGDEDAVETMIAATLDRFDRIDVLVNNAGTVVQGDLTEIRTSDYRRVMATLVDGTFFCSRAALPYLVRTRGCIVNTDSVSGLGGDWGMSVYNLAKGGIANFTRALALDYGARGVRVNAVAPTLTRTRLTRDVFDHPDLLEKFRDRIAMDRPGEPEDVAAVIAFLASKDAGFVTGVVLPVDGGLMASNGQPRQA